MPYATYHYAGVQDAAVTLIVAFLILFGLAMFIMSARKEDEPRVKSSRDSEVAKLVYYNGLRIEAALSEKSKELAVRIVGKYMQAVCQSQSLSVLISLEQEVSPEVLNRAAELLITKGWEISDCSFEPTLQMKVTPVEPRKTLRKHRPGAAIGGARYWG